jgi:sialidase-1
MSKSIHSPYYAFPTKVLAGATEQFPRRDEPSMVEIDDGHFLFAYANHEGRSDNDTSNIAAMRISPEGDPVGEERILVAAPKGGLNAMSPALRRLPDGRLGMVYSYRVSTKIAERHFRYSKDQGQTWSEPVIVATGNYKTGRHDSFTILSTGRFLAPCHCADDWDDHHLDVRVARSDDAGESWTLSDPVELPRVRWPEAVSTGWIESGCIEPFAAERSDGSVLMTLRTAMGTQFYSESFDGGELWSLPKSMEVISSIAPAHLTRLPGSDDLLLVWTSGFNVRESGMGLRHTISACISKDGGLSWPHDRRRIVVHDTGQSNDYPFVVYNGDEVWIIMRHSEGSGILSKAVSSILMRVPLSWFYE